MCYDMYDPKQNKMGGGVPSNDDEKEEKAFSLLKLLKDQKMSNRQYAQMREDYYRALGDLN